MIAWRYPSTYGWAPYPDGLPDLAGTAKRTLIAALAEVSGLEPDVLVRPIVTEGHAAGALLDATSRRSPSGTGPTCDPSLENPSSRD